MILCIYCVREERLFFCSKENNVNNNLLVQDMQKLSTDITASNVEVPKMPNLAPEQMPAAHARLPTQPSPSTHATSPSLKLLESLLVEQNSAKSQQKVLPKLEHEAPHLSPQQVSPQSSGEKRKRGKKLYW